MCQGAWFGTLFLGDEARLLVDTSGRHGQMIWLILGVAQSTEVADAKFVCAQRLYRLDERSEK
jgi:hypothetical protein